MWLGGAPPGSKGDDAGDRGLSYKNRNTPGGQGGHRREVGGTTDTRSAPCPPPAPHRAPLEPHLKSAGLQAPLSTHGPGAPGKSECRTQNIHFLRSRQEPWRGAKTQVERTALFSFHFLKVTEPQGRPQM